MVLRLCFPEEETLPVDAPAIFPIYIVQFNAYGDTKTFVLNSFKYVAAGVHYTSDGVHSLSSLVHIM